MFCLFQVALWLLRPDEKERPLPNAVLTVAPRLASLLGTLGPGASRGCGSVAMSSGGGASASAARSRACAEAAIVAGMWHELEGQLMHAGLGKAFRSELGYY